MKISGLLLFQCLIVQMHHTQSARSPLTSTSGTQIPFTLRQSEEINGSTGPGPRIECPSVWYKYNSTTQDCQCIPLTSTLICDGENTYTNIHHIVTYNANERVITEVKMRHSYLRGYNTTYEGSYILLPNSVTELNHYMCDPLNRRDYMCRKCKNGYGPAVSFQSVLCASRCYLCKSTWRDLLLYLSVKFIPLTVFYLFILVFRVGLTSAPMTCFIMYCQLTVIAFYEECGLNPSTYKGATVINQVKFDTKGNLRTGSKIILTLYSMFNLDFFLSALPPLCVSSLLRPIHIFLLGYASAFYPFILIFLTWLCIELHGRNFRPIVWLWRPFHGCFVRLRRGWNTKSDLIDVFASFFLLSYSRIMYQIMLTFNVVDTTDYSLRDGHITRNYVLQYDFGITMHNFKTADPTFIFMACFAVILSLLFIIFPMLLLFLYPTKIFRRLLLANCVHNRLRIFLYTFLEKFHFCYRDGLNGTKDMRSFSGIYFLLRVLIYLTGEISRITLNFNPPLVQGFVFSITALFIALSQPYRKTWTNIMDSVLLLHMATICYIRESLNDSINRPRLFLPLMTLIILLPFLVAFVLTTHRLIRGSGNLQYLPGSLLKCLKKANLCNQDLASQNLTTYGTITVPES